MKGCFWLNQPNCCCRLSWCPSIYIHQHRHGKKSSNHFLFSCYVLLFPFPVSITTFHLHFESLNRWRLIDRVRCHTWKERKKFKSFPHINGGKTLAGILAQGSSSDEIADLDICQLLNLICTRFLFSFSPAPGFSHSSFVCSCLLRRRRRRGAEEKGIKLMENLLTTGKFSTYISTIYCCMKYLLASWLLDLTNVTRPSRKE